MELLVIPSSNVFQAIARTAVQLRSSEIFLGASPTITPAWQARRLGEAWEQLPDPPRHQVLLKIMDPDGKIHEFSMGAHAPDMTSQDIRLIHALWLDLVKNPKLGHLHHRDVLSLALHRLEEDLRNEDPQTVVLGLPGSKKKGGKVERSKPDRIGELQPMPGGKDGRKG